MEQNVIGYFLLGVNFIEFFRAVTEISSRREYAIVLGVMDPVHEMVTWYKNTLLNGRRHRGARKTKVNIQGCHFTGRGCGFPPATKNEAPGYFHRKTGEPIEPKEIPSCLIPLLLVVFMWQIEILVTALEISFLFKVPLPCLPSSSSVFLYHVTIS